MKKRTKRTFSIHHWCGLIAGIFLLAISLSGSVLVFHDEIDNALYKSQLGLPEPAAGLSIDRSFEFIRGNNPGWEIRIPGLPENNQEGLKYELRQQNLRKWVIVHPAGGQLVGTVDRADKRLVNVLLTLHYSFFAGTTGKIFVFCCGLAFLALLVTGLFLYRKSFLKVIFFQQRISFKSRKAYFSSLHRVLGVWGLVFNMLICITGIWMANVVITSALKRNTTAINVQVSTISIDRVLQQIKKEQPEFEIHYLRFPTNAEEKLTISGRLKSDPAYYGKFYSRLQVDYQTGQIAQVQLLRDKPFIDRFTTILQPMHFGNYAGFWVKVIYTIGGLLPGILAVSGFFIWRYRGEKKEVTANKKVLRVSINK